jgi:hypothetical protein
MENGKIIKASIPYAAKRDLKKKNIKGKKVTTICMLVK